MITKLKKYGERNELETYGKRSRDPEIDEEENKYHKGGTGDSQ